MSASSARASPSRARSRRTPRCARPPTNVSQPSCSIQPLPQAVGARRPGAAGAAGRRTARRRFSNTVERTRRGSSSTSPTVRQTCISVEGAQVARSSAPLRRDRSGARQHRRQRGLAGPGRASAFRRGAPGRPPARRAPAVPAHPALRPGRRARPGSTAGRAGEPAPPPPAWSPRARPGVRRQPVQARGRPRRAARGRRRASPAAAAPERPRRDRSGCRPRRRARHGHRRDRRPQGRDKRGRCRPARHRARARSVASASCREEASHRVGTTSSSTWPARGCPAPASWPARPAPRSPRPRPPGGGPSSPAAAATTRAAARAAPAAGASSAVHHHGPHHEDREAADSGARTRSCWCEHAVDVVDNPGERLAATVRAARDERANALERPCTSIRSAASWPTSRCAYRSTGRAMPKARTATMATIRNSTGGCAASPGDEPGGGDGQRRCPRRRRAPPSSGLGVDPSVSSRRRAAARPHGSAPGERGRGARPASAHRRRRAPAARRVRDHHDGGAASHRRVSATTCSVAASMAPTARRPAPAARASTARREPGPLTGRRPPSPPRGRCRRRAERVHQRPTRSSAADLVVRGMRAARAGRCRRSRRRARDAEGPGRTSAATRSSPRVAVAPRCTATPRLRLAEPASRVEERGFAAAGRPAGPRRWSVYGHTRAAAPRGPERRTGR